MPSHIPCMSACVFVLVLVVLPLKSLGIRVDLNQRDIIGEFISKRSVEDHNTTASGNMFVEVASLVADVSGWLGGPSGNWIAFAGDSAAGQTVYMCGGVDTANSVANALSIDESLRGKTRCEQDFGGAKFILTVVGAVAGAAGMLAGAHVTPVILPANLGAASSALSKGVDALEAWWCGPEIWAMKKFQIELAKAKRAHEERLRRQRAEMEKFAKDTEAFLFERGYFGLGIKAAGTKENTEEIRQAARNKAIHDDNSLRMALGLPPNGQHVSIPSKPQVELSDTERAALRQKIKRDDEDLRMAILPRSNETGPSLASQSSKKTQAAQARK